MKPVIELNTNSSRKSIPFHLLESEKKTLEDESSTPTYVMRNLESRLEIIARNLEIIVNVNE
jgi:hypothetical protein